MKKTFCDSCGEEIRCHNSVRVFKVTPKRFVRAPRCGVPLLPPLPAIGLVLPQTLDLCKHCVIECLSDALDVPAHQAVPNLNDTPIP